MVKGGSKLLKMELLYLVNFEVKLRAGYEVVEPLTDDSVLTLLHQAVVQQVFDKTVSSTITRILNKSFRLLL
jgi:hypothetical protein